MRSDGMQWISPVRLRQESVQAVEQLSVRQRLTGICSGSGRQESIQVAANKNLFRQAVADNFVQQNLFRWWPTEI